MNSADYPNRRQVNGPGYAVGPPYGHPAAQGAGMRSTQYLSTGAPMMQSGHGEGMAGLGHAFSTMTMGSGQNTYGMRGSSHLPASSADYAINQSAYYNIPASGQNMVYPNSLMPGVTAGQAGSMYPQLGQYVPQANYPSGYNQPVGTDAGHPVQSWAATRVPSEATHSTVPTLITPRRGSISSNEEHIPATPYNNYHGYHGGVAIVDRSPSGPYTNNNNTPSPSSSIYPYGLAKPYHNPPISMQLQMLLKQDPAIPPAIPAPSSPVKPLDRCLENKNGETNVYIRGLLPETTDEMLHAWGSRFGDIQSSKSIIDHKNTLCKGFGFIKYHNFEDAEACIRGFHYLGYEVSFARESFYSKLKKFSDELNTNLYVSNIPRNFNEHELSNVFIPYKVCSARILRDERGNGRGVGFARFETREICEEIINTFNNSIVQKPGQEDHIIQIRYSDTHEQKSLKQQTAAARQFRAAEFEYGCTQALRAGLLPPQSAERVQALSGSAGVVTPHEFENYMQQHGHAAGPYIPPPMLGTGRRNLMSFIPASVPLPSIKSEPSIKIESSVSPVAGESGNIGNTDEATDERSSTPASASKTVVRTSPVKESA